MIGQALRIYRVGIGLKLRDMSQLTGLSITQIGRIERGQRSITAASREKLLAAFEQAGLDAPLMASLTRLLEREEA